MDASRRLTCTCSWLARTPSRWLAWAVGADILVSVLSVCAEVDKRRGCCTFAGTAAERIRILEGREKVVMCVSVCVLCVCREVACLGCYGAREEEEGERERAVVLSLSLCLPLSTKSARPFLARALQTPPLSPHRNHSQSPIELISVSMQVQKGLSLRSNAVHKSLGRSGAARSRKKNGLFTPAPPPSSRHHHHHPNPPPPPSRRPSRRTAPSGARAPPGRRPKAPARPPRGSAPARS